MLMTPPVLGQGGGGRRRLRRVLGVVLGILVLAASWAGALYVMRSTAEADIVASAQEVISLEVGHARDRELAALRDMIASAHWLSSPWRSPDGYHLRRGVKLRVSASGGYPWQVVREASERGPELVVRLDHMDCLAVAERSVVKLQELRSGPTINKLIMVAVEDGVVLIELDRGAVWKIPLQEP